MSIKPLLVKPSDAFKLYFKIRGERTLPRLVKELNQAYAKRVQEGGGRLPHLSTLKKWSVKYHWLKKVKEWDAKKDDKAEDETIEKVAMEDKTILDICKAWMNIFANVSKGKPMRHKVTGEIIKDDKGNPVLIPPYIDAFGFKAIWEIYQVVRGQVTERIAFTKDDKELLTALENASEKDKKKILKHLAQIDAIKRRSENIPPDDRHSAKPKS